MYFTEKLTYSYRERSRVKHMIHKQNAYSSCRATLGKKQKRSKTTPRRGEPRLTDPRGAHTSFGVTTTHSLPTFFSGEYGDRFPLTAFGSIKSKWSFVQGIQCAHENGNFQQASVLDQCTANLGDRSRILPRVHHEH